MIISQSMRPPRLAPLEFGPAHLHGNLHRRIPLLGDRHLAELIKDGCSTVRGLRLPTVVGHIGRVVVRVSGRCAQRPVDT